MPEKKNSLRLLSIVEIAVGVVYAVAIFLAIINKSGLGTIATALVDVCIALYMIMLIKEIHG